MLFPILRPSSLSAVVAQPDKRHANRTASVFVLTRKYLNKSSPDDLHGKTCCREFYRFSNFKVSSMLNFNDLVKLMVFIFTMT